jgi:hypothetical protein
MARLIGNYQVQSTPPDDSAGPATDNKGETTVSEFEKRAFARLGGSIAFVMKGKSVVWNGENKSEDSPA